MIVELAWQDVLTCAIVGVRRNVVALANQQQEFARNNSHGEPFELNIAGAIGEFAVARVLHRNWNCKVVLNDLPDIAGGIEVRTRRIPGAGSDLEIKAKDHDERPFVLVHVHRERINKPELIGWLYGHEGKFWYNDPSALRTIDELVALYRIDGVAF